MAEPVTTAAATSPWWGPAAIAAGGAILQGGISSAFNARQAEKNRDWQEDMSSSAHQREVADLRAAGLNPILSARHGGASSPGGSSAQASSPDVVHSAMQAQLVKAQIRDINSAAVLKDAQSGDINATQLQRIDLLIAQKRLALEERAFKSGQGMALQAEIDTLEERKRIIINESKSSAYGLDHARSESEFYRGTGGKLAPWMKFNPLGNTGINFLRLKNK